MPRALKVCNVSGCPALTRGGRCDEHERQADRARGTSTQRGYGSDHRRRFRRLVLERDPTCTVCGVEPSVHADHYPRSRKDLVAAGLDPNDPQYGRGVGAVCHAKETAKHQPGGWNAR